MRGMEGGGTERLQRAVQDGEIVEQDEYLPEYFNGQVDYISEIAALADKAINYLHYTCL